MEDQSKQERWDQINRRLEVITASKPIGSEDTDEEQKLLGELDEIEYEIGIL